MIRALAFISSCIFLFTVLPADAQSETENLRYISDKLVINLRDQLEKPYSVVDIVHSGDPVRIIEEQNDYFKVETEAKKQGWIAKQYLDQEIPDALIVQQLRQEITGLNARLESASACQPDTKNETTEACGVLRQKLDNAEKEVKRLQEQQNQSAVIGSPETKQDQALAAQLEQTSQRYNQLIVEYEKRGQEIAELQNTIAKQDDTTRFLWFGAGAAVFFLGLLAGRSASRKKNKFLY